VNFIISSTRAMCLKLARVLNKSVEELFQLAPEHQTTEQAVDLPPVRALIETLAFTSFRREIEDCTGYDMRTSGDRLF
jgi:DNA-binding XRE family transcriptional regulator